MLTTLAVLASDCERGEAHVRGPPNNQKVRKKKRRKKRKKWILLAVFHVARPRAPAFTSTWPVIPSWQGNFEEAGRNVDPLGRSYFCRRTCGLAERVRTRLCRQKARPNGETEKEIERDRNEEEREDWCGRRGERKSRGNASFLGKKLGIRESISLLSGSCVSAKATWGWEGREKVPLCRTLYSLPSRFFFFLRK